VRAGAIILLGAMLACQPPTSVVRVGDLTVRLHLPADQAPLDGLVSLVLRVVDENGRQLAERHYGPDDPIDFELRPIGDVVEVVLEGYRDRETLAARGATGPVVADGAHEVGLFLGLRQRFAALEPTALPAPIEHAAVALADGGVLFAGGRQAGHALDRVWRYDPVSAQFVDVGTLAVARSRIAAGRLGDGRVLLVGGLDESGAAVADIDVYEPDGDQVRPVSSSIGAIGGACAVTLSSGRIAVAGGSTSAGDSRTLLIFDASLGPPQSHTLPHPGRSRHACAGLADGLVAVGGQADASTTFAHFAGDDPAGLFGLPSHVVDASAFADGSALAVVCGSEEEARSVAIGADDSAQLSDRWRLAIARTGCSATPLRDGTLLVVGGRSGGLDIAAAEVAGAASDPIALPDVIEARAQHSATRLPGGEVLVVGGDGLPPQIYVPWREPTRSWLGWSRPTPLPRSSCTSIAATPGSCWWRWCCRRSARTPRSMRSRRRCLRDFQT
jgi:hypothetical protein